MIRSDSSFSLPETSAAHLLEISRLLFRGDHKPGPDTRCLPEFGAGDEAALRSLAPRMLGGATDVGSDSFFAHMDPPSPWVTWICCYWNAMLNQNLLHPATSPVAREIEEMVLDWLSPSFGANGGMFVPGSTIANITAIWAAREIRKVTEVVASHDAHVSVKKAADILGLKYRSISVDEKGRMRPEHLGNLSASVLVLTAGTTSTGAIDPLEIGREAAWRHVDAAWAGPLRLSCRYRHLLDGIELADSAAVSAHKLLFQPKESALVFFKTYETVKRALSYGGPYLTTPNVGMMGSHGAAAIPLYATLLAWGRVGLQKRLDRCMECAESLAALVESSSEFELFSPPTTGIVLWRPKSLSVVESFTRIKDATVSTITVGGFQWLRSVAANPLVDVDKFFDNIRRACVD